MVLNSPKSQGPKKRVTIWHKNRKHRQLAEVCCRAVQRTSENGPENHKIKLNRTREEIFRLDFFWKKVFFSSSISCVSSLSTLISIIFLFLKAYQVPCSSILVGQLILLNVVRFGRFGGGWLSNPSWTFTAALNWAWQSYLATQCYVILTNNEVIYPSRQSVFPCES